MFTCARSFKPNHYVYWISRFYGVITIQFLYLQPPLNDALSVSVNPQPAIITVAPVTDAQTVGIAPLVTASPITIAPLATAVPYEDTTALADVPMIKSEPTENSDSGRRRKSKYKANMIYLLLYT